MFAFESRASKTWIGRHWSKLGSFGVAQSHNETDTSNYVGNRNNCLEAELRNKM